MRSRLILLLFVAGCVDGPFERTNPFDPDREMTMELVGGRDTVTAVGQTMLFQLVTDPVVVGFQPLWESAVPTRLSSLGHGRFVVLTLPPGTPQSVAVRAEFGSHVVERTVVLMPVAP